MSQNAATAQTEQMIASALELSAKPGLSAFELAALNFALNTNA